MDTSRKARAECYGGNFLSIGHSAPFGNWGVVSPCGRMYDGHQFDGWYRDPNDNNGPCTQQVAGVQVFDGLSMALYELDSAWVFRRLEADSEHVTTLRYPRVTVPLSCSGSTCTGQSGWYCPTEVDWTGVTSTIKVAVSVE